VPSTGFLDLTLWDAAEVAAKAVTYAATFGAAGGVMFLALCHSVLAASDRVRIRRLVGLLLVLSAFASGIKISVTAGSMGADLSGMVNGTFLRMILQTDEGRALGARVIGLLLMIPGVAADRRPSLLTLLAAMAAATAFAWTGHTHALGARMPAVLLICLHLLGAGFWLGALLPLLMIAENPDPARVTAATGRFGAAAALIVGVLLAAGFGLLWMLAGDWSNLWATAYGRGMSLKVSLVAGLLGFAAWNKWSLTPRLQAHDIRAAQSLRRSIKCELLLAGLILLVTAGLTTLTGPPVLE
jgi:copper resistance protein D